MTTIDLSNGVAVDRKHVPTHLLTTFDEASSRYQQARSAVGNWLDSLQALQAPANFSGSVMCTMPGQSGRTYNLPEIGGALLVEARDVPAFSNLGFTAVPSAQPASGLRVGLVYFDPVAKAYWRYDGTAWTAMALI